MRRNRTPAALTLGLALIAPAISRADYDLTFGTAAGATVGGSPVGATAEFIGSGTTLTIILTDTAATASRSQLLSGVFFNVSGGSSPVSATYTTPTAVVTPGSKQYTGAATSATSTVASPIDVTGAFLFAQTPTGLGTTNGPPSITFGQHYGLSATGDSPLFPSNKFGKGNGSDDYALAGPGTDLGASSFGSAFPLIQNSVTFTITGFHVGTGINDVVFAFGSAPGGTATGVPAKPVPEPGSIASLALGGAVVLGWRRRRERRAVPA